MQAEAKLTDQGQVTIPQAIQQVLRAKGGDTLVFEMDEDGVRVHVRRPASFHKYAKYAGIGRQGKGASIAEIVAEIRDMRGE